MYKVIKLFNDLQDNRYEYCVGDTYPRKGVNPSKERIAELLGSENLQGQSLIEEIEEEPKAEEEPEVEEKTKPARQRKKKEE